MKAYSMDLRERVVVACGCGDGTHEAVAQRSCGGSSEYTACSGAARPARSSPSPTAARSPRSTRPPPHTLDPCTPCIFGR